MKKLLLSCLISLGLLTRAGAAVEDGVRQKPVVEDKRFLMAVRTEAAPQIDGRLDDAVWEKSPESSGFVQLSQEHAGAKYPTFVRCLYDAHNVYFAFRNIQPAAGLRTTAVNEGTVWNDDCVELFITPHIATTLLQTRFPDEQHFHMIFNSAGTRFDELGNGGGASWDGDWEVKTSVSPDEWHAEVRIPFTAMYNQDRPPAELSSWNIQIGRTAPEEYSTYFPGVGLYRLHSGFGPLIFVSQATDSGTIRWNLDRQKNLPPRLSALRETLGQMKPRPKSPQSAQISVVGKAVDEIETQFNAIQPTSYSPATQKGLLDRLAKLEADTRSLQESIVIAQMKQGETLALAPHPAVKDKNLVRPDYLPALPTIGKPVQVTVTPEEYQAASFVLWTAKTHRNVNIAVEDLRPVPGGKGKAKSVKPLPKDAVDVRWVKCWYQAGSNDIVAEGKILVPELLLKNPNLVRVDYEKQENITLITPGMREREYPADADTLLPQTQLDARSATQVWLTVHVPKGTAPGLYRGNVSVLSGKQRLGELPLEIRVLDFQLAPSMLDHNWYTRSVWGLTDNESGQNDERSLAEIRNLVRHGVTHVGLLERMQQLGKAVRLMKEGGLRTDKLYITGEGNATFDTSVPLDVVRERAAGWVAAAKAAAPDSELYLYLQDEARGEALIQERANADIIHAAGAKTWVACYPDYFPLAGDIIDVPIMSGAIVGSELVDKIHARGARIFSYGNPQGGVEKPEIYRRNYGLRLWQANYDGAFDFAWYCSFGPYIAEWNPWDDFLHPYWRQHCMVYPTKNGVVDTIQWEGWREGVNDCRYLATLLREVESAKKAGRNTRRIAEAEKWIADLKAGGDRALENLDDVRAGLIAQIQAVRATR